MASGFISRFRFALNVIRAHSCAANSVNFISEKKKKRNKKKRRFCAACLSASWLPACSTYSSLLYHPFTNPFLSPPLSPRYCSEKFLSRYLFVEMIALPRGGQTFGERKTPQNGMRFPRVVSFLSFSFFFLDTISFYNN